MTAKSVGERAKRDADALSARSMDRGLRLKTQGVRGADLDVTTGKPLKMGNIRRNNRIDNKESQLAKQADNSPDNPPNDDPYDDIWDEVDSAYILGLMHGDDELEALEARLEVLRNQIPELFDLHDQTAFEKLQALSVPEKYASLFEKLLVLQEQHMKSFNAHNV